MYNRAYQIAGKELARLASEQACNLTNKRCGRKSVWLLVLTDDILGEKASVCVFATEEDAKQAMLIEINEDIATGNILSEDLEYSEEENFAYTKDMRFSYEIIESGIWRTTPRPQSKHNQQMDNG